MSDATQGRWDPTISFAIKTALDAILVLKELVPFSPFIVLSGKEVNALLSMPLLLLLTLPTMVLLLLLLTSLLCVLKVDGRIEYSLLTACGYCNVC